MNKLLLFIFILSFSNIYSQDTLKAYFDHKVDTIFTGTNKEVSHSFKVIVPNQPKLKGAKVEFSVEQNDMETADIFLPTDKSLEVGKSADTIKKEFTVKFNRSDKDDRLLKLKLNAVKADGTKLSLVDSSIIYIVYVKPKAFDTLQAAGLNGHEFWLFTGTNLDFIDGPKLKELYFKASYLLHLKHDKEFTKSWFYLTAGRNRYFSDRDSLSRIPFTDIVLKATPGDSITIANGYYNSFRQTVTENYYASLKYLYQLNNLSTEGSQLFLNAGFYFALQTLKTSYTTHDIISDTNTYLRDPNKVYNFQPIQSASKVKQFNSNLSLGIVHILTTKSINVKSHFDVGLNMFNYPYINYINRSLQEFTAYKSDKRLFVQLGFEGTAINSGISLGFESFIRAGDVPLFNVSLTKVVQLEQIGNLFGKVTPGTN